MMAIRIRRSQSSENISRTDHGAEANTASLKLALAFRASTLRLGR